MLSRITIHNLVIVRSLDLAFEPGMTALTGETGAGKSILIDALGLALGDKADSTMIRAGADKADISVGFDIKQNSPAHDWLEQHDFDADGECLLRRVLVRQGRSRAYINGTPATQARLREIGELLVDIHGQHAHQSLLHAAAQRQLLDAYAGLRDLAHDVARRYKTWREAGNAFDTLKRASDDRATRLDYLRFQVAEMDGIVCDADTQQQLETEHARLAHAERLLSESSSVLGTLTDDEPSLLESISHAGQVLGALAELDPALGEACDLIETAGIQIDEAGSMLRHYQDRVELDPERLQAIDQQLGRLHDLGRKHRVDPTALAQLFDTLSTEIDTLEHADGNLAEREHALQQAEKDYHAAAQKLGRARRRAAKDLSKTITASMQTLGMKGGQLHIDVASDAATPTAHGLDRVAFLVAANPGQPEGALSDVASGGELSRISLAIQVATANCGSVPSLIFDEVDVGIGGAVAEIVGQLLRRLGAERQVMCVTHLPQVASQAHRQLRVHKTTDGKTTEIRIDALDESARVDEIARMMGGVSITEQTRKHADEMIQRARQAG